MENIKFIFFDLDNTLLDHTHAEKIALHQTFENDLKEIVHADFDSFKTVYHEINTRLWSLYSQSKISKDEVRLGRFRDSLKYFGIIDFDIKKLWENYALRYRGNWKPIEYSSEILHYLNDKNYRLGIISNGFTELQNDKIKKMGWTHYFKSIILSEEIGVQKPNPLIFKSALKSSQMDVSEVIYIGDSYETDISGAKNSGWKSIYFNPNGLNSEDSTVTTIVELNDLKKYF